MGAIREGITLWTPTLFSDAFELDESSAVEMLLIIPLINVLGLIFVGKLTKLLPHRYEHPLALKYGMMIVLAAIAILIFGNMKALSVLFISLISALAYGCNTFAFLSCLSTSGVTT